MNDAEDTPSNDAALDPSHGDAALDDDGDIIAPDPSAPPETLIDDDGLLTVSPDELQLPTPILAEPVISPDVAAEASLHEVNAEAEAVEQEVEQAGTLAGGRLSKSASDKEAVSQKIQAAASKARAEVTDEQEP